MKFDINFIINNVTATLAIEGLKPSESAVAINRQFLEGKISSKQAIQMIKDKYTGGSNNGRSDKNRK